MKIPEISEMKPEAAAGMTDAERSFFRPASGKASAHRAGNELIKKAAAYVFSTVCGLALSAGMLFLCAFVMYIIGLPPYTAGVLSVFSLGAGCMLSGFVCGSIKEHGGLKHGFRCAVIMTAVIMLVSLISGELDGSAAAVKAITAVITGCAGGVFGVNRRSE